MAPTIIKVNKFRFRSKIAAFDYDWTLIKPKSIARIPKNIDDWQWIVPDVPRIIKNYYDNGYCIVIFTNQSKQWKIDQIKNVTNTLNIPLAIYIGIDKEDQKPNTIMFDTFVNNKKWDNKKSFFVGDALGRKCDWSNTDKVFADSIGISVKTPEEIFKIDYTKINNSNQNILNNSTNEIVPLKQQEVVITIGYPASGKTTLVNKTFGNNDRYVIIHGDDYKTSKKMIQVSLKYLKDGKSIIFDATNPTKEKREEYIQFIKTNFPNVIIRCVHLSTSIEEAMSRNKTRPENEKVPDIVFYIYRKKFQQPSNDEGCQVITI